MYIHRPNFARARSRPINPRRPVGLGLYVPLGAGTDRPGAISESDIVRTAATRINQRRFQQAEARAVATGTPQAVQLVVPVNDAGQAVRHTGGDATTMVAIQSGVGVPATITNPEYIPPPASMFGPVPPPAPNPNAPAPVAPQSVAPPDASPTTTSSAPPPPDSSPSGTPSGTPESGGNVGASGTGASGTGTTPSATAPALPAEELAPPVDDILLSPAPPLDFASGGSGDEMPTVQTAGASGSWWLVAAAVALYLVTRKRGHRT